MQKLKFAVLLACKERHRNAEVNPHWFLFPASAFGPSLMPEMRFYDYTGLCKGIQQRSDTSRAIFLSIPSNILFPKAQWVCIQSSRYSVSEGALSFAKLFPLWLHRHLSSLYLWAKSDVRTFSFVKWLFSTGEKLKLNQKYGEKCLDPTQISCHKLSQSISGRHLPKFLTRAKQLFLTELCLKASAFCFLIFLACECIPACFGDAPAAQRSRSKGSGGNGTLALLSSGSVFLAGTQPCCLAQRQHATFQAHLGLIWQTSSMETTDLFWGDMGHPYRERQKWKHSWVGIKPADK